MKENNLLYQAFTNKNYHEIEKLLFSEEAKDLIDITFENNDNILHLAAEYGYHQIIPRIIELGIDKESKDNNGITPMHFAARNGHNRIYYHLN